MFETISCAGHEWGTHRADGYNESCAAREVDVLLPDEDSRTALLSGLKWVKKKSGIGGRVCIADLPRFGLNKADRLEPCDGLSDIEDLNHVQLPVHVKLWRRRMVGQTCLDAVLRRNSLLNEALLGDVRSTMRVDTLHTLYLGVCQFYV